MRKKKVVPSKGMEKCKSVKEITVKRRQLGGVSRNTHEPELMKTYSTANLRHKFVEKQESMVLPDKTKKLRLR